jgi:hypothetical protein
MYLLLILIIVLIIFLIWNYKRDSIGKQDKYVSSKDYPSRVHILHPVKTGGLSLRKAVGCGCPGGIDIIHGETERETDSCHYPSRKGRFICHGHRSTADSIPKDEPYVIIFRDPEERAKSLSKYARRDIRMVLFGEPSLSEYIDFHNPPAMILHTETLEKDYQEFKKRFCPPGECADSISHYHDSKKDPSHYHVKFGPEEQEYVREIWGDDYDLPSKLSH